MNAAKENTLKCELYHDNYQNYRRYNIPKAQLIIADIAFTGSNPVFSICQLVKQPGRTPGQQSNDAGEDPARRFSL